MRFSTTTIPPQPPRLESITIILTPNEAAMLVCAIGPTNGIKAVHDYRAAGNYKGIADHVTSLHEAHLGYSDLFSNIIDALTGREKQ
jgi:hypothetical protein